MVGNRNEPAVERLSKPVRITEQVWPEGTRPVVSVFNWTYNHAKFIRQSIDSILMQKTRFPVEIIIHDDASTDGTTQIIRDFQAKYPKLFFNKIQSENQWSQGKSVVSDLFTRPRGEILALTHGDDYWTDPYKLEIQASFIEERPSVSCCFHTSSLVDEEGVTISQCYYRPLKDTFSFSDCVSTLRKKYATSSMVFRTKALHPPRFWLQANPNDQFIELQLALAGHIAFLDRNMSAYRKHHNGVWTGAHPKERTLQLLYRYQLLLLDAEVTTLAGEQITSLIKQTEDNLRHTSECGIMGAWRNALRDFARGTG